MTGHEPVNLQVKPTTYIRAPQARSRLARPTAARPAATSNARAPFATGVSCWSARCRRGAVTQSWTWAGVLGCACRCYGARWAPRERSWGSTNPSRCCEWPRSEWPSTAGTTCACWPPRWRVRISTPPRMPPYSARCTTCCSPPRHWSTSLTTCVPAHRWQPPAGNRQPHDEPTTPPRRVSERPAGTVIHTWPLRVRLSRRLVGFTVSSPELACS
jgi:hypothetical protein